MRIWPDRPSRRYARGFDHPGRFLRRQMGDGDSLGLYGTFAELTRHETEGRDYRIRFSEGKSGLLIMAPHGGTIEPGTGALAEAIAGKEHALYIFEGIKKTGNADLHITSRLFDEPMACRMAARADVVLTIHGCKDGDDAVFLGGRDPALRKRIREALVSANFAIHENNRIPGINPHNICNRGRSGKGVQLEISATLRRRMFRFAPHSAQRTPTIDFDRFVAALKSALPRSQ